VSDLSDQAEVLRQLQARLAQLEAGQQRRAATHGAVLDALPAHVAMLDAQGVIVSVNRAWQEFAAANGGTASDIGKDYAALCDGAVGEHAEEAARAARCIRSVLGRPGAQDAFEYPCHSPTEQRWFRMTATALPPDLDGAAADGVMVMHIRALCALSEDGVRCRWPEPTAPRV
jgi:PAS domain-containing protein